MSGTILSVLFAVLFALYGVQAGWVPSFSSPFLLVASFILLFLAFWGRASFSKSVLRCQIKVMGCSEELFAKDMKLKMSLSYLFLFTLFSLFLNFTQPAQPLLFYLWLVGFGVGFDLLRFYYSRSFQYSSMPFLVERLAQDLQAAVQNKDERKAFQAVEVVIDAAVKATKRQQIRLAGEALGAIQTLTETYVTELSKSQVREVASKNGSNLTFLDKVNSFCIFVSERLQWLFDMALEEGCEPVAESIIAEFGKLSVFYARHNALVATIPLTFLAKCADKAKAQGQADLLTRIALTLSETSKMLLAYTKERNESFRDLVMTALATLEDVVKMIFKLNRDVNVLFLMQPFAEIGQFIGSTEMSSFPDRDEVIKAIRRVLTEFQALQVVTKNVETMASAEDSTSSYSQDTTYGQK